MFDSPSNLQNVWQNIAYFYTSLGLNTPECLKNQAQTEDPTHTPKVRAPVLQTVYQVAALAPKFTLTLQGPAGRGAWEEGRIIPLGNTSAHCQSDLCIPSPVAEDVLSPLARSEDGQDSEWCQDSELDRKTLATLGGASPFTQISSVKSLTFQWSKLTQSGFFQHRSKNPSGFFDWDVNIQGSAYHRPCCGMVCSGLQKSETLCSLLTHLEPLIGAVLTSLSWPQSS